jgi:hypothetical protein
MLITRPSRRRALNVPALTILAALACAVVLFWKAAPAAAIFAGLFALVSLWQLCALSRRGGAIVLWRPYGSRSLDAGRCAFGYRVTASARPVIEVYVTDGGERHRVLSHTPFGTGGAERSVRRLEAALLGSEASVVAAGGAVAQADRAQIAETTDVVRRYYASKAWKRSGIVIAAVVLLYLVGVALFSILTGQPL